MSIPPLPPARRRNPATLAGRKGAGRAQSPRTRRVYVASPTVPGAVESVEKVIDTIEHMMRAKQLGERQYRAAEMFRTAWDALVAATGNTMDLDRVRGAGLPGKPPSAQFLEAADTIRDAKKCLYPRDFQLVSMIVGEGRSIKDAAAILEESTRDCGRDLRRALEELGARWIKWAERRDEARVKHAPYRAFDRRQFTVTTGELRASPVAHVSARGVKMSGAA